MFLCDTIVNFINNNPDKKIIIFCDMDGVIADYRFGEGDNIRNNIQGTYLNKRPLHTTISNLKYIAKKTGLEICILSSCLFQEQVNEKNQWLDKYADYFEHENRYFVLPKDFDGRKDMKIDKLMEIIRNRDIDVAILIDDTHDILFEAISRLNNKVLPFHVSALID